MALGVAVTLWAAGHQRDRIEATRSAAFTKLERDSLRAVTDNLRACERLLRSVQTVFMASDAVSADEFATLYQTLRPRAEFPSLQALAYAERTPFEGGERHRQGPAVAEADDLAGNHAAASRLDVAAVADRQRTLHPADLDHHAQHRGHAAVQPEIRHLVEVAHEMTQQGRHRILHRIAAAGRLSWPTGLNELPEGR